MLASLRKWIAKLSPSDTGKTVWSDYAQSHSYTSEEYDRKKALIAEFCGTVRPRLLWDFGCNTGDFAKVALAAGTEFVVGFDMDQQALDLGFIRAQRENLNFLPLVLDLANPSPNQGWAEAERAGIGKRRSADGLIALALIHHLAIGRNIPLPCIVDWLIDAAPQGVIEFVPKSDPMVVQLLRLREDIFDGYTEDCFAAHLGSRAKIVKSVESSATGRRLFWYTRNNV